MNSTIVSQISSKPIDNNSNSKACDLSSSSIVSVVDKIDLNKVITYKELDSYSHKNSIVKIMMKDYNQQTIDNLMSYIGVKVGLGQELQNHITSFFIDYALFLVIRTISGVFMKDEIFVDHCESLKVENYMNNSPCVKVDTYNWNATQVIQKLSNLAMIQNTCGIISGNQIVKEFSEDKKSLVQVYRNLSLDWLMENTLHMLEETAPSQRGETGRRKCAIDEYDVCNAGRSLFDCGMSIEKFDKKMKKIEIENNKKRQFCFKDPTIFSFLIAQNIFLCLKDYYQKITSAQTGKNKKILSILPRNVVNILTDFKNSSDITLIVFGLITKDETFNDQIVKSLFIELRNHKNIRSLSACTIIQWCIEILYEIKDYSVMLFDVYRDAIQAPSNNILIDYSLNNIHQSRSLYMMSSTAYFITRHKLASGFVLPRYLISDDDWKIFNSFFTIEEDNNSDHIPLEIMDFSSNSLQNTRLIIPLLNRCHYVTNLNLNNCNIGDRGMKVINEYLHCYPLANLQLANNCLTDVCSRDLNSCLCHILQLEILNISGNSFTDVAMVLLLKNSFQRQPLLRSLNMSNNVISDKSVNQLCCVLDLMPELRELNISRNYLTSIESIKLIKKVLFKTNIRYFDIQYNKLSCNNFKYLDDLVHKASDEKNIYYALQKTNSMNNYHLPKSMTLSPSTNKSNLNTPANMKTAILNITNSTLNKSKVEISKAGVIKESLHVNTTGAYGDAALSSPKRYVALSSSSPSSAPARSPVSSPPPRKHPSREEGGIIDYDGLVNSPRYRSRLRTEGSLRLGRPIRSGASPLRRSVLEEFNKSLAESSKDSPITNENSRLYRKVINQFESNSSTMNKKKENEALRKRFLM